MAIDLLTSVCNVMPRVSLSSHSHHEIALLASCAHALLVATPERIDEALLLNCRRLRVIACAFRIPEHVDIAACTRRGIWVTTVMTNRLGRDAELEAARNILDVLSGYTQRGALNEILRLRPERSHPSLCSVPLPGEIRTEIDGKARSQE